MWGGEADKPQTLNKYAYAANNPMKYIDFWGLRAMTEHEQEISKYMYKMYFDALETLHGEEAEIYLKLYSFYVSTIDGLDEGGDPESFTIMNDAIFKWYEQQTGKDTEGWAYTSDPKSDYYAFKRNTHKCSSFVAEVLLDAVGYKNNKHGKLWEKRPPLAVDWYNHDVEGFSAVTEPEFGDVIAFDLISQGSTFDHVGIYLGNGLYISATDTRRSKEYKQPDDGIRILIIPDDDATYSRKN